jgi:hypothetical protein
MQVDIGDTAWGFSCVSCGNIYYDLYERYKRIYYSEEFGPGRDRHDDIFHSRFLILGRTTST